MDPLLVKLGGSVLAVALLIGLTWLMGFRDSARLASEDEARALMRLAPGGFEPVAIALDAAGRAAVALDADGRLLVLVPHGNCFVPRPLDPASLSQTADGALQVTCEGRVIAIEPASDSQGWAAIGMAAS